MNPIKRVFAWLRRRAMAGPPKVTAPPPVVFPSEGQVGFSDLP